MEDEDKFAPTPHGCVVVNGVGVFDTKWVFGLESNICTCGALGEGQTYESSPLTLHEIDCASTPCPMCSYEQKSVPGGGTITQNSAG
jgi:hypothetical protein